MPLVGPALGSTAPARHIFMPTRDQLIATYSGIIHGAQANGTLVQLKHAPAHADRYPSYPVTPNRLMGVRQDAFVIKGEIYVKTTAFTRNPQHVSWAKAGPAPLF